MTADEQNIVSLRHYLETALKDYKDAHARVHELEAQSIGLARQNMEYRLGILNNLREEVLSDRGLMVTLDKFEGKIAEIERTMAAKTEADNGRIAPLEDAVSQMKGRMAVYAGLLGVCLVIAELLMHFVFK